MTKLFYQLLELRRRPYIITECFLCLFLVFMLVLSGPRFGRFATLSGGMVVLSFGMEVLLRGELGRYLEKLSPMIPYILFVLLSVLVMPLIPYAGSRAWNNGTGMAILIVTFLVVRRMGKLQLLEYAFPLAVLAISFFMFVAPGLIGAEASTGRLNNRVNYESTLTGGSQNASALSVIVGVAYFMALSGLMRSGIALRRLIQPDNLMYLAALLSGFYLVVLRSGSRQGLIWIFLAAMFCYAIYTRRHIVLGLMFAIPVGLMLSAGAFFAFRDTVAVQRIIDIFDPVARTFNPEKSLEFRLEMLQVGFDLWAQSPLWGNGNEAFRVMAGLDGYYSHNNYIELLCNYGGLGFFLFYFPMMSVLWMALSGFFAHQHDHLKKEYLWIAFAVVSVLVSNMFMPSYYMKHVLVFMAIVMGRLYYLKDNESQILRQRPAPARGPRPRFY
ncbi:MAG: O-antigen ligase family protein [Opitutae bacterium]|nr:O-antigen ligase family protein [Opitutae bacterium]